MILAPLADAGRYYGLHPLFARAFAWIADPANRALPVGRHPIVADRLEAIIDEGVTRDPAAGRLESHRANIDIQVSLAGGETIEWAPLAGLVVETPFAPDGDIAFYRQPPTAAAVHVAPGWAAIFWPEDAHKPILHARGAAAPYRKVVFKVRIG